MTDQSPGRLRKPSPSIQSNIRLPPKDGMATIRGADPEPSMNIHLTTDDPKAVWSHHFLEELKVELRRTPDQLEDVEPIRRRIDRPEAMSADDGTIGLVIKAVQAGVAAVALVYTVVRNYIKDAEERESRRARAASTAPGSGGVWLVRIGGQQEFRVTPQADLPDQVRAMIEAAPSADVEIVIKRLGP